MYYQTKSGSKKISSSKDRHSHILITWALAYWGITIPSLETKYLVVLKASCGHSLTFWPFTVTLTLNAVIQFFSQNTLAYDDVLSDQVWLPRNQQFRRYGRKSHILIKWALAVILTLKIGNNFFSASHSGSWCCITIPSVVTKYSAVQKIPSGKKFTDILNFHCDLDLEPSNKNFPTGHPSLWCCTIKPSLVANRPAVVKI